MTCRAGHSCLSSAGSSTLTISADGGALRQPACKRLETTKHGGPRDV
jgi:hypothetical protein